MSHISKPVDWEVFNIPQVQPVQYYSILKKKKEFSQHLYETQVFRHGYVHYCSIVPKNISSSLNSKYEIIIVFFDEIPNTSFIGFRVKVSKETFIHESNSLILFLKKSEKVVFYLMNNNSIHVQCGKNAWELFYRLYDDYLRRYVLTFIGTQFFYHFVYSDCIQRERQLLEMLYKGSKVIRVSKRSIYYKIHKKRKISVTDLIHMTLNMPKSKRYVISCFSSKESLLYSDLEEGDFCTAVGSKINVSKLVLKRFKKQSENILSLNTDNNSVAFEEMAAPLDSIFYLHSESVPKFKTCKSNKQIFSSNTAMKRKIEEVENNKNDIEPGPSTSKFIRTTNLSSGNEVHEDQWEQYQNLKPYAVKSYSGIPCISHLVPNLLNNGKSSHFVNSNSYLLNTDCNVSVFTLTSLNKDSNNSVSEFKPINLETHLDSVEPNEFFPNRQEYENHELVDFCPKNLCEASDNKSSIPVKTTNDINQDYFSTVKDVDFTTATGKTINISNTAMLTAHKLIENEFNDENPQICRKTSSFKHNYPDSIKKSVIGYKPLAKISVNKPSNGIKLLKDEETSKNFESVVSAKDENFRLDNFHTVEDDCFSTAAGKRITVSNTAMQAAHKLIQNMFNEEKNPSISTSIDAHKNKICKNRSDLLKDIGCTSRKSIDEDMAEVDMDKTLVEKFFEDTIFDEKELESATECNRNENSDLMLASKSDISSRKPRKSLGGRRSIKYCSDKL